MCVGGFCLLFSWLLATGARLVSPGAQCSPVVGDALALDAVSGPVPCRRRARLGTPYEDPA